MALPKKAEHAESETSRFAYMESEKLWDIESELCTELEKLEFTSPIEYIYNPLKYATDLHKTFIVKYFDKSTKKILFLGINPGPWGMCQSGIPFGDRDHVKNWFKITGSVGKPDKEHPKKKITGLNCNRIEDSGKKFWGLFQILCESPENFFKNSFVYNLCPLAFTDAQGKNITPRPEDIKDATDLNRLLYVCEEALIKIIKEFKFEKVIAIGRFPEKRANIALKRHNISNIKVVYMLHPSSLSPKSRKDWKLKAFTTLQEHGLIKYFTENENIDVNLLRDKNEPK